MNTTMPSGAATLSVVIPSYRSRHLDRVVEGLEADEIIVVDSSPEAPMVPEGCTLIHRDEQTWAGHARNIGARKATGDILLFLDSDVVLTSEARDFIRDYRATGGEGIVCGIYENRAEDNVATRLQNHVLGYRLFRRWNGHPPVGSSSHFLIRRETFARIGGFNETLQSYEDIEFFVRARKLGFGCTASERFTGHHFKHFDARGLIEDYAGKVFRAVLVRKRFAALFKDDGANLGRDVTLTWLVGAALPLLLPLTLAFPVLLPLLLAALAAPLALWRSVLAGSDWGVRLASLILWPAIGATVVAASLAAQVRWMWDKARLTIRELADYGVTLHRVLWRDGRPIQMIQYVTARCNLRCEHCFYKNSLDAPNPGELPAEVLEGVMRDTGPVLWYSLAGGEPFLRKDLARLMLAVQRHNRPKVFSFPTNGWYTERTFDMVLRYLHAAPRGNLMLFFSLDGPEEVHDAIRGPKSYARVRETMDRLRPLQALYPNLLLNVVTTVQPGNMEHFPGFIDRVAEEFRPNAISINLFRYHRLDHPPLPPRLIDAYGAACDAYRRLLGRKGLAHYSFTGGRVLRLKEILQKELIERVARTNEFVTPCTAGTLSYVVMEDARLLPCEILSDSLGKVDEHPLAEMIRSPEAASLRRRIRDEKCRCTYECANSSNVLFSWPMTRRLIAAYLRDLLGKRAA